MIKVILVKNLSKENIKILKKFGRKTTSAFCGLVHSNDMDEETIIPSLSAALKHGVKSIEVMSHPAFINHPKDKKYISPFLVWYANLPQRKIEANALLSKGLQRFIQKNQILLSNYRNL